MTAIKNRKPSNLFRPNIEIIDCGKKESLIVRRVHTEKEAENFIENHERPWDLICKFDEHSKK